LIRLLGRARDRLIACASSGRTGEAPRIGRRLGDNRVVERHPLLAGGSARRHETPQPAIEALHPCLADISSKRRRSATRTERDARGHNCCRPREARPGRSRARSRKRGTCVQRAAPVLRRHARRGNIRLRPYARLDTSPGRAPDWAASSMRCGAVPGREDVKFRGWARIGGAGPLTIVGARAAGPDLRAGHSSTSVGGDQYQRRLAAAAESEAMAMCLPGMSASAVPCV